MNKPWGAPKRIVRQQRDNQTMIKIDEWTINVTHHGRRKTLVVFLSKAALKCAIKLLRERGYTSIYPVRESA